MISNTVLKELSEEFIGDTSESLYSYKSGPQIVDFFNEYFDENDLYGKGFPSRWKYVHDKLGEFEQEDKLQLFFQIILSSKFLRTYEGCNRATVEAAISEKINRFNHILDKEDLEIKYDNKQIIITPFYDDLLEIGSGGFATVYSTSNNQRARKVLLPEFNNDDGVKHRFKREYEITKSLQDIDGIIPLFDNYNVAEYSYEMKYCETNLESFIKDNELNVQQKIEIVKIILNILAQVHQRNTIHRDLSPNNILINNSKIYIADFGIGKDFNNKYSHQTMHTRAFGQFRYAAPEQLENLSDATTRSDVFSLGKIINFIFNKNPENNNHILISFSSKSTARNPEYRYEDASVLSTDITKYLKSKEEVDFEERILLKMQQEIVDDEVSSYVLTLNETELSDLLAKKVYAKNIYIKVLENNSSQAYDILLKLTSGVRNGYNWNAYDQFSFIAYSILNHQSGTFDYDSRIKAAELLDFTAHEVNRFDAQNKIESLIENGLDPTLEDILK